MFLPVQRMFQAILLSLATGSLLLLVGCIQESDTKQAKQNNDPVEKARTDSVTEGVVPCEGPTSAKADEEVKALSHNGKSLADWIAELRDKDKEVRIKAAQALGEISKGEEPPPEAVLCALAQAFKDEDHLVRFVTSQSLNRYGKHAARLRVKALKEGIKADDVQMRRDAVSYLGECGGQQEAVVPILGEALLKDTDAEVRQNAAFALGRIGKLAVPALLTALKVPDRETRLLAVRAFRFFYNYSRRYARPAIPVLAEQLKEDDEQFRFEVAQVLKDFGDEAGEALPAVLLASKVHDNGVDAAREALEKIRKAPRSTAPALIALLKDEKPRIRLKAAEVLCDMEEGDKECLSCLLEPIKRRDSQIRDGAARLLCRYGSAAKADVPALIEVIRTDDLMSNGNPQTRMHAINALGAIDADAKAAIPLLKAMQDDRQLGGYAKTALKKIE